MRQRVTLNENETEDTQRDRTRKRETETETKRKQKGRWQKRLNSPDVARCSTDPVCLSILCQ